MSVELEKVAKSTIRIQTVDAIIVKEIQWGEVKTQTFIGDKTHIERKDIKRLGYKSVAERGFLGQRPQAATSSSTRPV